MNRELPVLVPPGECEAFAEMRFCYPFWRYQRMILEVVARKSGERMATTAPESPQNTFHIVAPPGSGKTIVGLELVRRFGRPAVIFSPTTTIQGQWQERLDLFVDGERSSDWISEHSSLDPGRLTEINALTYQVLSTPGENLAFVERIAVERWVDDLVSSDQVRTETEARDRVTALRESNPKMYRREVAKRYRRVKREFLQRGDVDGRRFLHPNARDLIDRIVEMGVGTVILDECHHLLDYWAFILRTLISELRQAAAEDPELEVRVVGLTATLPSATSRIAYENYTSLLGDVDFEVPTPAVVKEGNLAPYRDLVYFCQPSPREHRYLRTIQEQFEGALTQITRTPAFQRWLWRTIVERFPDEGGADAHPGPEPFERFFNREPALCVAGVKFLLSEGRDLPADVAVIEEMQAALTVDDWLTLLETFGLRVLKVSAAEADHALYRELRKVLLTFGITLTERGARHQRSPGELVLTLSESKDRATAEILRAEAKEIGPRLRAVVLTDFERMSARSRHLKDILDPDAGSAVRVFRHLIADAGTNALDPILVTGGVVLVDADNRELLETGIRRWMAETQATFDWMWQPTDDPRVLKFTGSGKGWGSRVYVSLITDLFEQGITRCLVGTRGLFGEGWDALSLNTLINLTAVTTSTGVRQIRGRSLRLDPAWPEKVAHNWDVVCYSRRFDKGDIDVRRLVGRHAHTWGIVIRHGYEDLATAAAQAIAGLVVDVSLQGQIVRGVGHVDLELAQELAFRPFKQVNFEKYTQRMLRAVRRRDKVRDLWRVGDAYSNFIYSATQLQAEDLKFRTVHTVQTSLRTMVWRLLVSLVSVALGIWAMGLRELAGTLGTSFFVAGLAAIVIVGVLVSLIVNARAIWKVFRATFVELPADAVLLDIGRALLAALRDAGLVSRSLDDKYVRVAETATGGYQVFLDYASPEDSALFARAYRELLGPVGDARYLIERDSASLRNLIYRPLWLLVRTVLGLGAELRAYHRVPDVLATRRERAESLSKHWHHYVGGGRLVYTRSGEGRQILLKARSQRRHRPRQMAFELWT